MTFPPPPPSTSSSTTTTSTSCSSSGSLVADKQDRKRFLGCLAAILASTYDWEHQSIEVVTGIQEEGEEDEEEEDMNVLDDDDNIQQMGGDDDDKGNSNTSKTISSSSSSSLLPISSNSNPKDPWPTTTMSQQYQEQQQYNDPLWMNNPSTSSSSANNNHNDDDPWWSSSTNPNTNNTTNTCTTSTKPISKPQQRLASIRSSLANHGRNFGKTTTTTSNVNIKSSGNGTPPTTATNKFKASFTNASNRLSGRVGDSSNNNKNSNTVVDGNNTKTNNNNKRQQQKAMELAMIVTRYRKRRHKVLSKLLISSSHLLLLNNKNDNNSPKDEEEDYSMAYLPMLDPLHATIESSSFSPATTSTTTTNSRSTSGSPDGMSRRMESMSLSSSSTASSIAAAAASTTSVTEETISTKQSFFEQEEDIFLEQQIDIIPNLKPFLHSLSPGSGYRCLVCMLIQHLLSSTEYGYDARIRYALKRLGVLILIQDDRKMMVFSDNSRNHHDTTKETTSTKGNQGSSSGNSGSNDSTSRSGEKEKVSKLSWSEYVAKATRQFESLEHFIAVQLILLAQQQQEQSRQQQKNKLPSDSTVATTTSSQTNSTTTSNSNRRKQIIRGLKIGGAAVAAGTLLAVTGGLAAPAMAATVGFLVGGGAVTAALTSTAAVTAIFGVGGGTLVAYKMQRRTKGLTEFEFQKENSIQPLLSSSSSLSQQKQQQEDTIDGELFTTICISGWLRDSCDFQRPWGVQPSKPPIVDLQELLERFYSIHKPDLIPTCSHILERWKGREHELWNQLKIKYGRTPSHLYPLDKGAWIRSSLTRQQKDVVLEIMEGIGCKIDSVKQPMSTDQHASSKPIIANVPEIESQSASFNEPVNRVDVVSSKTTNEMRDANQSQIPSLQTDTSELLKHLATVWDYHAHYGGELYTVKWESSLLTELCNSVAKSALDLAASGTTRILKFTAMTTFLAAFAWPVALIGAANMIDGSWTLVCERSDLAGKELARSLLYSNAGHRPITLVGYSFGARVIYSCLKELARYQELWEDHQEGKQHLEQSTSSTMSSKGDQDDDFQRMREPASIVEDAILMGLPDYLNKHAWEACRRMTAGRLINCFSQKDLILSLMFRVKRFSGGLRPVCGVCPVNIRGVENIDVTDLVAGHQDYSYNTGAILTRVRHGQPFHSISSSFEAVVRKAKMEASTMVLETNESIGT